MYTCVASKPTITTECSCHVIFTSPVGVCHSTKSDAASGANLVFAITQTGCPSATYCCSSVSKAEPVRSITRVGR